jgi:hypothetical protein
MQCCWHLRNLNPWLKGSHSALGERQVEAQLGMPSWHLISDRKGVPTDNEPSDKCLSYKTSARDARGLERSFSRAVETNRSPAEKV